MTERPEQGLDRAARAGYGAEIPGPDRSANGGRVAHPGYTLSLDCGSTNLKAALFDRRLNRVAQQARPMTYLRWDRGWVEFDASQVWRTVAALIEQVCARAGIALDRVATISLTSQAQSFVLLDKDEMPLTPFVSWADTRATEQLPSLRQALGADFHAHCSFSQPMVELQLAKMLWIKEHDPCSLAQARSVVPLPTWLALRLTGVLAIDRNLAAMSGLYSQRLGTWWPQALELCSLSHDQLPALVEVGGSMRARRRCKQLALSDDLEIVFAGNDQTCGALANDCHEDTIVVTLGTALVAYRFAGRRPGPYGGTGCWGPFPGGGYYELAVCSQGCAALDWAREQLMPGCRVDAFVARAQSADEARRHHADVEGVFFYPDRMGSQSAWVGVRCPDQRALAVLEGIGFSLWRLLSEDLKIDRDRASITAIGGGSRSDLWLQLLADILVLAVRRGRGDPLLGAAMAASPGVVRPSVREGPVFRPDPVRAQRYPARYHKWRGYAD